MKKISVIMSTYKEKKKELKLAIESIINQTYTNFEFIIILDNPENLEHLDLIRNYCEKDNRIKFYINDKNLGLALSLNRGINLSEGEFIARMDADDIALPDRFEKEVKYLNNNLNVSVVATNKILIDENETIIGYGSKLPSDFNNIKKGLEHICMIVHPSVMFKKNDIKSIGNYRNYPASQDYDLWLRVLSNGLEIGFVDEYLIKYRSSNVNISGSNPLKQWLCDKYIKILYKERVKYGYDSFSEEKLNDFLIENRYDNDKEKEKFRKGKIAFDNSRNLLKKKRYLRSIIKMSESFFMHKEMKYVIINAIYYKKISRDKKEY